MAADTGNPNGSNPVGNKQGRHSLVRRWAELRWREQELVRRRLAQLLRIHYASL